MKKYILTLIIALLSIFTMSANDLKVEQVINNNISEVVVNIPSTIKVFKSFDDKIHIRFRTKDSYLLDNIYYKSNEDKLLINTNKYIYNISENNIIIYLFVPNDNIKYYTENHGLDVKIVSHNKNINTLNHGNND